MAENSSTGVCSEEKMVIDEISQQRDKVTSADGPDFLLEFDPRPQRTLSLNRRKFFLMNRDDEQESKSSSTVSPCKQSESEKSKVSEDRLKSPPSGNKVIKLASYNTVPIKQNGLKRNITDTSPNSSVNNSAETPSKKKHKPITWP